MIHLQPRTRYLLQETLLVLGFCYLLFFSGTNNRLVDPDLLRVSVILLLAVGAAWLLAGSRARTPLLAPLAAWVLLYAVSLPFSLEPRRSLDQMILMGVALFIFLLFYELGARGWPAELVIKAVLVSGAVLVALNLLQAGQWFQRWLAAAPGVWLPYLIYRPFAANVVAVLLNVIWALALARLVSAQTWGTRILLGLLVLADWVVLFLTSSRGGWLGAAGGLICLAALLMITGRIPWRTAWQKARRSPLLIGAGGLLLLAVIAAAGWLLYRQTVHPSHSASLVSSRAGLWGPALQAFRSAPLIGRGAFSYASFFLANNSVPPGDLYVHGHGTYTTLLGERGLLGFAAAAWLGLALLRRLARRLRTAQGADWFAAAGAAAALAALAVHGIFDCFHTEPAAPWLLAAVLGVTLGNGAELLPAKFSRRPWGVLLLAAGLIWTLWTAAPLDRGAQQANSGDWSTALASFEEAVRRDPLSPLADQQRGLAAAVLAAQTGDPALLVEAESALERLTAREPAWAANHLNLGAIYAARGRLDDARRADEEALRRAPQCALCQFNLAAVLERLGQPAAARQAYAAALELQPDWAASPSFALTPLRKETAAAYLREHPAALPPTLAQARQTVAENRQAMWAYVQAAGAALRENQLDEAARLLALGDLAYSDKAVDRLELTRLQGDLAAAQGDTARAEALHAAAAQGYAVPGLRGPGTFGYLMYASLLYRRPAVAVELVPQVEGVELGR